MFRGSLYDVVIAVLTFVAALVMTAREVDERGVRFEVTIQPIAKATPQSGDQAKGNQPKAPPTSNEPTEVIITNANR